MAVVSHRVLVAYHQAHLAPLGLSPVLDPAAEAGLAQVTDAGRGLVLLTGIAMGPVAVLVGDGSVEPSGEWQERQVAEMRLDEPLLLTAPTLEDAGPDEAVYVPTAPGAYVVTVLARGRRPERYDDVLDPDDEPFEEYAVLFSHA
jgi:hypothetical protein